MILQCSLIKILDTNISPGPQFKVTYNLTIVIPYATVIYTLFRKNISELIVKLIKHC